MVTEGEISKMFQGKKIVVTGGIGSIGAEIVRQLLTFSPEEIRIFDNRETELFYDTLEYTKRGAPVVPVHGDVRDYNSVFKVTKNVDFIFHTAAMKHVIMCEHSPFEAVKTNVIGTENVIQCALNNNVQHLTLISTDKAVNPTNVMGATKLLSERLVSAACRMTNNSNTRFSVVRFGNVLASRGSVLEIWRKELNRYNRISITDPNMTRFFMSIPDSVKLIFNATRLGGEGETFIFKMPSVKLGDFAEAYLDLQKSSGQFKIIGKKPGEKMHEDLINKEEEDYLLESDTMFMRLPIFFEPSKLKNYSKKGFKSPKSSSFTSDNPKNILRKKEIRKILEEAIPRVRVVN